MEDDYIVFPGEAELVKANPSEDRVYVLKFTSSTQKYFFWMQEPDSKKGEDAHFVKKINALINEPGVEFGGDMDAEADADADADTDAEVAAEGNEDGDISEDVMQILSRVVNAQPRSSASGPSTNLSPKSAN